VLQHQLSSTISIILELLQYLLQAQRRSKKNIDAVKSMGATRNEERSLLLCFLLPVLPTDFTLRPCGWRKKRLTDTEKGEDDGAVPLNCTTSVLLDSCEATY
jgi:hypothetical protein